MSDTENIGQYLGHGETAAAEAPEPKLHWATAKRLAKEAAALVSEGVSADASLAPSAIRTDDRAELIADIARIKAMRQPFGGFTQKLALAQRSGYHRHWFNDVPGRVDEAKDAGWSHVKGKDGQPIKRVVGSGRDKGALYAFAMEIPSVFWEEDMVARNREAASKMEALKASPFRSQSGQAKPSDNGKFYSPQEDAAPLSITKG